MTITTLHQAISAAGLPVVSVRKHADGSFTADLDNGTPEQYAQAKAIIDGFDFTEAAKQEQLDAQLAAIDSTITVRRLVEAILTGDKAWLQQKEIEKAALRAEKARGT